MTIFGDKNHKKGAFNLRDELIFHTLSKQVVRRCAFKIVTL